MAGSGKGGFFRRRPKVSQTFTVASPGRRQGPWAITSSAARLDVSDRQEAKVQRMLRQGWQADAWNYRDAIGELRYAVNFLANITARMRLYPACYPIGGESDNPVALDKAAGIPEGLVSVAAQAMQDLGNGRMAISGMLHGVSTNKTVAGESYLLGRTDEQTREQAWSVRSVDELVVQDDRWHLREIPGERQNGAIPWIELDPEQTVISRMWTPHPRFQLLADSPLRAMLDDCESLMILRRMIRATGRSRLATRGFLLMPDELALKVPVNDDEDPDADPFMAALGQAMMAPIVSEGTADGVVPIVIRGAAELLKEVRLLDPASQFDAQASKTREELLGIIATTLDMPKEVVIGIADVNHWTAWQISDDTFRQIEPHVISCCDDLSGAYLRPYLAAAGIDDFWVQRMVLWYDPAEVVTHPDQTKDALDLHDRLVISDEAMLKVSGFGEEDRPSKAEVQVRLLEKMRMWPPNLVMAFLHAWDPSLVAPPITVAGTIPGIKPSGVDTGEPAAPAPGAPVPPAAPAAGTGTPPPPKPALPPPGPPPADRPPAPAITASGALMNARLSRKLAAIDSDLRARLQTAANGAMLRQLERAGARLRTKVARDETLRSKIAHRSNERVPALLGPDVVTAAGLTASELIGSDWAGLRSQFYEWTEAAQAQALSTALRIGQLDADAAAAVRAQAAMAQGRDAAWELLSEALTSLGHHLLYSPDPNVGPGEWAGLNPDTLVPAGTIRAALGVAGGASSSTALLDPGTGSVTLESYVGQIGTGATVSDLLTSAGLEQAQFEWSHGPALNPFEPHEALDGEQFVNFDDDVLANPDSFPPNQYLFPGDHGGCLCDAVALWDFPGNPVNDSTAEE
jgi:hypothetical protein